MSESDEVVAFWRAAGADGWFRKDAAFDATIRTRFLAAMADAAAGRLAAWEATAEGAYALILLLDQFPRNVYRGDARAYAADPHALAVADRAIVRGFDRLVGDDERIFFYLPFEHSEDLADQQRAVALVRALGDADLLKWAQLHADIIRRFGRFPHRNGLLNRVTTAEEQAFLDAGGFAG
jgi:uncharacterized protein (DUF924 family)